MPKKAVPHRADRYDTLRNLLRGAIAENGGLVKIADVLNISHNTLSGRLLNPSDLRLREILGLVRSCRIDKDTLCFVLEKIIEGV